MSNDGLTIEDAERILEKIIAFPNIDGVFEHVKPITDFRKDDAEARILYICKRKEHENHKVNTGSQQTEEDLYVLKCKIQVPSVLPGGLKEPVPGPSEHTNAELEALRTFADTKSSSLPHLISWKKAVQGADGLMPGGYIIYTLMTLVPGQNLMDLKFWSLTELQRQQLRAAFLVAIKSVWRLGFEPYDCALRNIMWEAETRTLSLVDFEHWHPTDKDPMSMNERSEMQRWGIVHRPAAKDYWVEWSYAENLSAK